MTIVAAIVLADVAAGPQWGLAVLSIVPIGLAAWYAGSRVAALTVLTAAVGWLVHQPSLHAFPAPTLWNALARVVYFGLAARFVGVVRRNLRLESALAATDPLTGLLNRRAFWERAQHELRRAARYGHPITVAYVDLDNFKFVNDEQGHKTGDEVLCGVADTLRKRTRVTDLVGRLGGDEIAVLLPEAAPQQGVEALQGLRAALATLFAEQGWPVSTSVGAVTFWDIPDDVQEVVGSADTLMYEVKRAGKDHLEHRVVGECPPAETNARDNGAPRHSYFAMRRPGRADATRG